MATPSWGTDAPVEELLFTHPWEFDFFQAVMLLERRASKSATGGSGPGGTLDEGVRPTLLGAASQPDAEAVRFRARTSLNFPASAVYSVERPEKQPEMTVTFLGLTGTKGALPACYTDMALEQEARGDGALAAFLDLFNHRMISLFYRAWDKHHFLAGYERAARNDGEDSFTAHLFAAIGMGTDGLRGKLRTPDLALLRYAGLIAQRPHSASALQGLLRDYFDAPVEVDQLCGRWSVLEDGDLSYLDRQGAYNQLGMGAIAGDAVWNQQAFFRVRIGPLPFARFREFLPDGNAFAVAADLIRYFADRALEFEIQPVLAAGEVPWMRLTDETPDAPRLGWAAWLKTETFRQDAADATFSEPAARMGRAA